MGVASLFFYAWWNPAYLIVIFLSICANFLIARLIQANPVQARAILIAGVAANVVVLCYFKYVAFLSNQYYALIGSESRLEQGEIPLGISFFTFVQIAYLVDAFRRETAKYTFLEYTAFVTYFPHLIAGPIIHHKDVIPLFREPGTYRFDWSNVSVGVSLFAIGLFKKTMIADRLAPTADAVFNAGIPLTFFESWIGTLAYTLQIYFDFSAYSDMALGLSMLVGIRLPVNFYSPYQATNIIDFWRRWHISLSMFLRDYVYIPLGGNRHGKIRRYVNLMLTMLIGGIWHGAGWTFLIWGGLHGAYLVVNHGFRSVKERFTERLPFQIPELLSRGVSVAITFIAVAVGWVFFRAKDFDAAYMMCEGLLGLNGVSVPYGLAKILPDALTGGLRWGGFFPYIAELRSGGIFADPIGELFRGSAFVVLLLPFVFFAPNAVKLLAEYRPGLGGLGESSWLRWRPNAVWAVIVAVLFLIGLVNLNQQSVFLYFQF